MHLDLFSGKSITVHGQDGGVYTPEVSAATVRALIAVAAFAGLRHGEIRGLWWEDDEDDRLTIRRSVWRTQVKDTKTHEDEENPGVVPIIRPLRVLLDAIRPAKRLRLDLPQQCRRGARPRQHCRESVQACLQGQWSRLERLARLSSRARDESEKARHARHYHTSHSPA